MSENNRLRQSSKAPREEIVVVPLTDEMRAECAARVADAYARAIVAAGGRDAYLESQARLAEYADRICGRA